MLIITGLLIGIAFGFIIHRVGASQYRNILNTLLLKDLKVLRFMVFSIATGMIGVYVLKLFGLANFSIKPAYIIGVSLGGLIFGTGFAVAGYCPGTAVCALGEGKKDAFYTILGGIAGAFIYSLVYSPLKPFLIDRLNTGKITLADLLPVPELITALVIAVIFIVIAFKLKDRTYSKKGQLN